MDYLTSRKQGTAGGGVPSGSLLGKRTEETGILHAEGFGMDWHLHSAENCSNCSSFNTILRT